MNFFHTNYIIFPTYGTNLIFFSNNKKSLVKKAYKGHNWKCEEYAIACEQAAASARWFFMLLPRTQSSTSSTKTSL